MSKIKTFETIIEQCKSIISLFQKIAIKNIHKEIKPNQDFPRGQHWMLNGCLILKTNGYNDLLQLVHHPKYHGFQSRATYIKPSNKKQSKNQSLPA